MGFVETLRYQESHFVSVASNGHECARHW